MRDEQNLSDLFLRQKYWQIHAEEKVNLSTVQDLHRTHVESELLRTELRGFGFYETKKTLKFFQSLYS